MKTVNLNKATAAELQAIVHIGPIRAKQIIAGRKFRDIHEISKLLGLGRIRMSHIINQNIDIQF